MASASSSANVEWAGATRAAIGRPRRGVETRTEQTALPDKAQLAIASRLTKLKSEIDKLQVVAPDKAAVVLGKFELLKRSVLAGNAVSTETPLTQLESVVTQLLVQSKPKSGASSPPRRTPPPPPPTPPTPPTAPKIASPDKATPLPMEGFDPPTPPPTITSPEQATPLPAEGFDPPPPPVEVTSPDKATPLPLDEDLRLEMEADRLNDAKAKIATLGAAPADKSSYTAVDNRARSEAARKTLELSALLKAGSENQDQNIHRDVLLGLTHSKDQAYIDNVQKPCDAALKTIADAVAAKKPIEPSLTKRLELLLGQLDEQRAHYANKTGITDRAMKEQRDNKVAAIDKRKAALSAAIDKVKDIVKTQETVEAGARGARREQLKADGTHAAVMRLAENLQDMKATDAVAAAKSIKDLQAYLGKADPVTRQVLFQDMKSKTAIADILKETGVASANGMIADIVKAKSGGDTTFLDDLSAELIQSEIRALSPVGGRGNALRDDSLASKVSGQYNKTNRHGEAFIDQANKRALQGIAAVSGDLEIDPNRITGMPEPKKQQAIAERVEKHKALAREAIDGITKAIVPPEVAKICAVIYEEAMAKFKTPSGDGDEQQAMILVGGHLMLRLIAPGLAAAQGDPTLTDAQRKAITMQMKLLQNISNNVPPGGAKEAHMNGFADLVKTKEGRRSPEVEKLQSYMKKAVIEGKDIESFLNRDPARAILMEFCVAEYNDENLLFWEAVRAGVPANPKMVYDTYISASAAKQINLPSDLQGAFDKINAALAPNWAAAPWAKAKKQITDLMRRDCYQRFKASPRALDAIQIANG